MKIDMLENIYGMICEKMLLCGTEIWGGRWGRKKWTGHRRDSVRIC